MFIFLNHPNLFLQWDTSLLILSSFSATLALLDLDSVYDTQATDVNQVIIYHRRKHSQRTLFNPPVQHG